MSEKDCEEEVRGRAKALRVRNWHNRRLEDLIDLVREEEERLVATGGVALPLDGVMSVVGPEGRERLIAYVNALEVLQGHEELVAWMDKLAGVWIVSGVDVELLWAKWKKEVDLALVSWAPYADPKRFSSLCSAWCVCAGWSLEAGVITTGALPPLMPSWHLRTWSDVTAAVDRRRAEQLFSVLVNG